MDQATRNQPTPFTFLTKKIDFNRGDKQDLIAQCQEWGLDGETTNIALRCIRNGALFAHMVDGKFAGLSGLEFIGPDSAYLHMLPKTYGREFFGPIKAWAREAGMACIQVSSSNLNGSNFRYFEKTLGFRRTSVVYTYNLCPTQK